MKGKEITIQRHEVKSQRDAILHHLKTEGSINSLQAIERIGATRLSSHIHSLREEGYNIQSVPFNVTNRYGNIANMVEYKYIKPENHAN